MTSTDTSAANRQPPPQTAFQAIKRTLSGKCPNCATGKLWKSYLKQVDECSSCGEPLGDVRADDGPPWLTILLVGHILAPVMVLITTHNIPVWITMTVLLSIATGMCLAILPFAKALFLAIIWKSNAGEEQDFQ